MYFIYYNQDTSDIMSWSKHDTDETPGILPDGYQYITSDTTPPPFSWITNGVLINRPDSPGDDYMWNTTSRTWAIPMDKFITASTQRIEQGRLSRNYTVIVYDGSNLDGNAVAQRNISNKITELQQSITLGIATPPELLIWRDADNEMHSFGTQQELLNWLGGLAIALAQRGTDAYLWAWGQKTALATAVTNNDLDAIKAIPTT